MDAEMKPVICFYKEQQLIFSEDYTFLSTEENVTDFLLNIENLYFDKMKIVQINFDYKVACVFVLNSYRLIDPNEIKIEQNVDLVFKPEISKNQFMDKIKTIKNDIGAGRYYQVNLTSKFTANTSEDGLSLFKKYLSVFKSRYSAYLPMKDFEILCYSPELFLEKSDSTLRAQPIKGTQTSSLKQLLSSEKETAELSMIVDLLRNDLNSICAEPVKVTKHRDVLDLGYIQHTYSEISGQTDLSLPLILKSTFPGGSISGCPKVESIKAITELEPTPRGFYTGSIGWWHKNNFKLNIAIRSFKKQNDLTANCTVTYYAGCGIVFDSDAETEWHEFLTKAGHLNVQSR